MRYLIYDKITGEVYGESIYFETASVLLDVVLVRYPNAVLTDTEWEKGLEVLVVQWNGIG